MQGGLDIPGLTPFIDERHLVHAYTADVGPAHRSVDRFAIFCTQHSPRSGPNRALLEADPALAWRGDIVVFRMRNIEDSRALVNMRRGDDFLALQAVRA